MKVGRKGARSALGVVLPKRTRAASVALAVLLVATAALYVVGLDANGWANSFYSAAAQAGSVNWEAFLWGSSDAGNSITVDKPPASLWLMALSVRIFGLSSWSLLVPEALCGVAAVWILYETVRRAFGDWAGILAGAMLATTPIACLMFRFNNPDALLMLLLVGATHCVCRSLEPAEGREGNRSRTRWMAAAGVCVGLAFLTKQLQAFLVLPAFGLAFLTCSPTSWRRRWLDALAAFGALAVSAGWWVLLTVIVPSGSRPYFGGSQTDSFLELTFSYNGLGRITGTMTGAVVPGSSDATTGQSGMWGATGLSRLFDGVWGTQWSWLAPLALAGIVVGIVCTRAIRAGRHDGTHADDGRVSVLRRANVLAWGGWLVVTWAVFSFMGGTIHQYYTVALAPAAAALAAICIRLLWERRDRTWARVSSMALVAAETVWCVVLMERSDWAVPLRLATFALGVAAIVLEVVLWARSRRPSGRLKAPVRLEAAALACTLGAALVGPVAWSLYTATTGHSGSIVTAGPSVSSSGGGTGSGGGMGTRSTEQASASMEGPGDGSSTGGAPDGGSSMEMPDGSAMGEMPEMSGGTGGAPTTGDGSSGSSEAGPGSSMGPGGGPSGSGSAAGGASGLLGGGSSDVSDDLVAALEADSDSYTWVAAASGSQTAAAYQLATQLPVMPVGGFNGSDPSPTLEEFEQYVSEGKIHYYIAGGNGAGSTTKESSTTSGSSATEDGRGGSKGSGGGMTQLGGSQASSEIEAWVEENFRSTTVGGVTLYDLTQPVGS